MNISIIIFCYRGEEELLPMQARHFAQILPEAHIHLVDDSIDPIPKKLAKELKKLNPNIHYSQSSFNRNGNLNGKDAILGELHHMQQAAKTDNNTHGIIIKLDPDTLILRPQLLSSAWIQGVELFAVSGISAMYMGACYAMSPRLLKISRKIAKRLPWKQLRHDYPEDNAICNIANLANNGKPTLYINLQLAENSRHIGALDITTHNKPEQYSTAIKAASSASIITVGNGRSIGLPSAYRVKFMADILEHFTHQQNTTKQNDKQ